jgi:hypothetical protein
VTRQFAILIKVGLAIFCTLLVGWLYVIMMPIQKVVGIAAGFSLFYILAWFIATNVIIFRPAGRSCSSEYVSVA